MTNSTAVFLKFLSGCRKLVGLLLTDSGLWIVWGLSISLYYYYYYLDSLALFLYIMATSGQKRNARQSSVLCKQCCVCQLTFACELVAWELCAIILERVCFLPRPADSFSDLALVLVRAWARVLLLEHACASACVDACVTCVFDKYERAERRRILVHL